MAQRICRCEGSISPNVLDGYACGNPDCWRTGEVARSFEIFVAELIRSRSDVAAPMTDGEETE